HPSSPVAICASTSPSSSRFVSRADTAKTRGQPTLQPPVRRPIEPHNQLAIPDHQWPPNQRRILHHQVEHLLVAQRAHVEPQLPDGRAAGREDRRDRPAPQQPAQLFLTKWLLEKITQLQRRAPLLGEPPSIA